MDACMGARVYYYSCSFAHDMLHGTVSGEHPIYMRSSEEQFRVDRIIDWGIRRFDDERP